jgi:hypothetical protein
MPAFAFAADARDLIAASLHRGVLPVAVNPFVSIAICMAAVAAASK